MQATRSSWCWLPCPLIDGMEFAIEVGQDILKVMAGTGTSHFVNAYKGGATPRTFDYCCLDDIPFQVWSPLRGDLWSPSPDSRPATKKTSKLLPKMTAEKAVTPRRSRWHGC